MTKPNLRIAMPNHATTMEMSDAIMAMAKQTIAADPIVVVIIYETEAGVVRLAAPASKAVITGLIDKCHQDIHPEMYEA